MVWVTWVTWGFVAIVAVVVVVAAAISRGLLDVSFEPPYGPAEQPQPEAAASSPARSGVEWSEPAAGRPHPAGLAPEDAVATQAQHHPRTTGEPSDGSHEAQDR